MHTRHASCSTSLTIGGFASLSPQSSVRLRKQSNEKAPDQILIGSKGCAEDKVLVEAIKRGEEQAFLRLTERYHSAMVRVALTFVSSRALAEEVVGDTWMAVLNGIHQFERGSSFKTWIFYILTSQARTQSDNENRRASLPEKSLGSHGESTRTSRTAASGPDWDTLPSASPTIPSFRDEASPEQATLSNEQFTHLQAAIDKLPIILRQVILLRDVEGFNSNEVCRMLSVSVTQQRKVLHQARQRVRNALGENVNFQPVPSQS